MDRPTEHHVSAHRAECQRAIAVSLLGEHGIMRLLELRAAGVYYRTLARMAEDGFVQRVGCGLNQLPEADCKVCSVRKVCRMSEYQYYEFQAVDRPLAKAEQEMLRGLSTRARITATSFTNHYEWGDFKGDPNRLMESCFDLHLHVTNWGTRQLMMRVPKHFIDRHGLGVFLDEVDWMTLWTTGEHTIIDICRDEVEPDYDQ